MRPAGLGARPGGVARTLLILLLVLTTTIPRPQPR